MEKIIKLACFDVNGTLFDDTNIFLNTINAMLKNFRETSLTLEELREQFGQSWTKIFHDRRVPALEEELYRLYNREYLSQPRPKPFPDLRDTLTWLTERNIALAIVTTQKALVTDELLAHAGLASYFKIKLCSVSEKSHALIDVCWDLSILPSETIYIGDREHDMIAARKAGARGIGFSKGLHSRSRLADGKPTLIIDSHADLKKLSIFSSLTPR